jgi:molecular chaperone DnaK (HSP70)
MAKAVGIEAGTTNSVVAATMEDEQAEVMPNAEGAASPPALWNAGRDRADLLNPRRRRPLPPRLTSSGA